MDAFEDGFVGVEEEVDPAAEFLAQEQEDLGGLQEDLGFTSPPQEVHAPMTNGNMNMDFFSDEAEIQVEQHDDDVIQDAPEPPVATLTNGMGNMRVKEEPESIRQWKIAQQEKLKAKDENEEKKKQELKEQAQQELRDWYKHYEEQLQKTKETNRNNQEVLVSEVSEIEPGTEWERVSKHCDFNAKNARNVKDVSRMRGILLQLKQNPPTRN